MPIGNPSSQTVASEKYQKKVGYIPKTYKLKKEIVEAFSKSCEEKGISQSRAITDFMIKFINEKDERFHA